MNKFKLNKISIAVDKAFKESLDIVAKDAKAFFEKSFRDEGFTDNSFDKWQPRKGQLRGGLGAALKGSHFNTLPTLTKKRVLRRSLKIVKGFNMITIFTNVPYAARHNYGLDGMPQRKFMGHSRLLERRMRAKVTAKINTAIKNVQ